MFPELSLAPLVAPDHRLTDTHTDEQHDADRTHDDELQGVPTPPQHDQVKPTGAAVGNEAGADGCDQDVGGGNKPQPFSPSSFQRTPAPSESVQMLSCIERRRSTFEN